MSISDVLFGCSHERMSFPRTIKGRPAPLESIPQAGTYVVCLDCGKEFGYDWQQMRLLGPLKKMAPSTRTKTFSRWNVSIVSFILSIAGIAEDKKEAA